MERFAGKTVVVTGGNKGIGYAIAERFAAEGANVAIASYEPQVTEAADELAKSGARTLGVLCDVTDPNQVVSLYDAAEAEFGSIDISIQNAGVIYISKLEDVSLDEWNKTLAVNTTGCFLCCQEAIKRIRRHGRGGKLVNTASGQAREGFIYTPHYAASKFGVMGLTQSLAKEVALEKITVNAICPGIIYSEMWDYNDRVWGKMLGDYGPGELMAEWVQNIPMKRAGFGKDVAGLVAFLASEDADYITGQTVNVDGGLIMS
ncbi:SDR family oxidoreductase [Tropicimonas isoalkanivorans]|uniref:Meso-butanediol dehydrogenase / (S,S)-butanediol dehydrogenase / diacetyl reductase n=1 Tax=Tropicimonas isoalkanivorans TaxID=441112 RepID=A0A1I1Q5W8_9RHOB|nr:SDR family oxidoreductase [Tropicimonas isoalkanivorans]SFD17362.1 meso-butanediol dehydrogenase / (S,S)-butanediol dehydrogenase / diacetyl reductase [Tropicimonas isoalkanivorans]